MAECMIADADIGLEECARFGDGDDDDAFRIVLVVVITGEIDDADCDCKILWHNEREKKTKQKLFLISFHWQNCSEYQILKLLTGTPAAHGDDAVAALESELVEPYLTRLGNECSLNDSDGTVNSKKKKKKEKFRISYNTSNTFEIHLKYDFYLFPECRCFLHRPAIEWLYYACYRNGWTFDDAEISTFLAWQFSLWPNAPSHARFPFLFASIAVWMTIDK